MIKRDMLKNKRGRGTGEVIFRILEGLEDAAMTMPAMMGAIIESGYGASSAKIERAFERNMSRSAEPRRRQYQRYSMMVRYLSKQGMLSKENLRGEIRLRLTKQGREKLKKIKYERKHNLPGFGYEKSPGTKVVIVVYDIPEKRRKERDWLREILKRIGLEQLQQSVWVGKIIIPRRLIEDLALRNLADFVEIVEVGGKGTLEHLI